MGSVSLGAGHVRYERRGPIGYITLARPEKLNALNEDMSFALREAVDLIDLDDEAQIGIIAGEGRQAPPPASPGSMDRGPTGPGSIDREGMSR